MSGTNGPTPQDPDDGYELDCDTVSLAGRVSSPKPDVAANIEVGQYLSVVLHQDIVLLQVSDASATLGSFNHSKVVALIDCMRRGYKYIGIVRSKSDGNIRVLIRRPQQESA